MDIRLLRIVPLPMQDDCAGSEVWNQEIHIQAGAQILVQAQSGRGKTTLLLILYGLRQDYRGQVHFNGSDIRPLRHPDWSDIRKTRLACVFQDLQLFEDLTAGENVELKNRLTTHQTRREIEVMFETLGLADQMHNPVGKLSLGQKQRVAIIRALCQPFECLLLDEPFSHLDPENRRKAADLIREQCQKQGAGLVVTSLEPQSGLDCPTLLHL